MDYETLHTRHRPPTIGDVVGQQEVCSSLQSVLDNELSRAFLFAGPSGVGKTTLARAIAHQLNLDIVEIDAATKTGVNDVRDLQDLLNYQPFDHAGRLFIVDEAHMLSTAAWNALLKSIEEPLNWVYWAFCTTVPGKVLPTARNRCTTYHLKPVDSDLIYEVLNDILTAESELEVPDDVVYFCAEKAGGSVRKAIVSLGACNGIKNRKSAAVVLREIEDDDGNVIDLCRALMNLDMVDQQPLKIIKILKRLDGTNPETIRRVVLSYFTKVAINAKAVSVAADAVEVLHAFNTPYPSGNSIAPVLVSLRLLMFPVEE